MELALYKITAAGILYAFYWKSHIIPSLEEWQNKLWKYVSTSKIMLYLKKTKSNREFNLDTIHGL